MSTKLSDGRFWARARFGRKQKSLGVYATREEADAVERAFVQGTAEQPETDDRTVGGFGRVFLDRREKSGNRASRHDRNRWKTHIAGTPIAGMRLDCVSRAAVRTWIDGVAAKRTQSKNKPTKLISTATVARVLALLSACFNDAIEREMCVENPCQRIKLKRRVEDEDPWTYLEPSEQRALLECRNIPRDDRLLIAIALGTGIRQSELFRLKVDDVRIENEPGITLRKTKNGRNRTIPLFGIALEAMQAWLKRLPNYCPENPKGLVFPNREGGLRSCGHPLGQYQTPDGRKHDRWHIVLRVAGITRSVRWHDLRHSCASSLLCGWWGRRWTLAEIQSLLGHLSPATTARYAHLGESALKSAAVVTQGPELRAAAFSSISTVGQERFELSTDGLKERSRTPPDSDTYDLSSLACNSAALLVAQSTGDPAAARLATELAAKILDAVASTAKRRTG